MPKSIQSLLLTRLSMLLAAVVALWTVAPAASAKSFTDVPKSHWAYAAISSVTAKGSSGDYILNDYGSVFRPNKALLKSEMARALVIAAGRQSMAYTPVEIADVAPNHPSYASIQRALSMRLMGLDKNRNFLPGSAVRASSAEMIMVRWLKMRYPAHNWALLTNLSGKRWQPNPGWSVAVPSYLPAVVASRQLQLRVNHPSASDGLELTPRQAITRADAASMLQRGFDAGSSYGLYGLASYAQVTFPALSDRQKEITSLALKYIGYPYVWGGEYPTKDSPYGAQASGGFDCSGFAFYVMKMRFGYPLTVNERTGSAMAKNAKPRITRSGLKNGDLIFFGYNGPSSTVASIFHVGLYLGNGWFVHSTGSSDGVTIASLNASTYWKTNFAWGRRLLKPSELVLPSPAQ